MTTKKEQIQKEQQEAKDYLLNLFKADLEQGKNPLLWTSLKSVSRSGMTRTIDVFYMKENQPIRINWEIDKITSFNMTKDGYIKVGGCGMDMGFHLVYSLSRCLFNDVNFAKYKLSGRNGNKYETTDAGYILKQRWL
jgi:hypothetical protein